MMTKNPGFRGHVWTNATALILHPPPCQWNHRRVLSWCAHCFLQFERTMPTTQMRTPQPHAPKTWTDFFAAHLFASAHSSPCPASYSTKTRVHPCVETGFPTRPGLCRCATWIILFPPAPHHKASDVDQPFDSTTPKKKKKNTRQKNDSAQAHFCVYLSAQVRKRLAVKTSVLDLPRRTRACHTGAIWMPAS